MDDIRLVVLWAGLAAVAIAAIAWFGDRRRMRRSDPDAVGFMPWTSVFFWACLAALLLLAWAGGLWFRR